MSKIINTAVVADWLVTYAGAERVLCEMLKTVPHADLYAVIDFIDETTLSNIFHLRKKNIAIIYRLCRMQLSN